MFSQNDEEAAILRYFGEKPMHLLDIGAYNGVEFSNSRQLILNGWDAVLVEPDPRNVIKLMDLYSHNAHVVVVQAAISAEEILSFFWFEKERQWASTLSAECVRAHKVNINSGGELSMFSIKIQRLMFLGPFDFINIDAEWRDWDILTTMPQQMLDNCKLICIEPSRDHPRSEMREYLEKHGFKLYHETPENLLMTR